MRSTTWKRVAAAGAVVLGAAALPLAHADAAGDGVISGQLTGVGIDPETDNVAVFAYNDDGEGGEANVNEDGSFDITDLPAGSYTVGLRASPDEDVYLSDQLSAAVTVGAGESVVRDLGFVLISGAVTDSAPNPVTDGSVAVLSEDEEYSSSESYLDQSGHYDLLVLVEDGPQVLFTQTYDERLLSEFHDNAYVRADATPLALVPGTNRTIDVQLARSSRITGKIALPKGARDRDRIIRIDVEGAPDAFYGVANRSGTFSVPGMATGAFRVSFARASGIALTPGSYYKGVSEAKPGNAKIVPIEEIGQVLSLGTVTPLKGAKISGKIVDRARKGRGSLRVVAVPVNKSMSTRSAITVRSGRSKGTFVITGLTPGKYNVYVWNDSYPSPGDRDCKQRKIAKSAAATTARAKRLGTIVFSTRTSSRCG